MTPEKKAKLDAALVSSHQLTTELLAHHIGVDRKYAPGIARAFGLEAEGRTYPWRRIWRAIHSTEGALLSRHLADLKEKHPGSVILTGITDLESALRVPLIDFATMAERLGRKPDTLGKALREGRESLPFPMIYLAPRKRFFRDLEVRLWVQEEICLALPKPFKWAIPPRASSVDEISFEKNAQGAQPPADPGTKSIFAGFAGGSRTSAA